MKFKAVIENTSGTRAETPTLEGFEAANSLKFLCTENADAPDGR